MNLLKGTIHHIETHGSISIVIVQVGTLFLKSIVLENPDTATYLQLNHPVNIYFKETEVIVSKAGDLEISLQNKLPCILEELQVGQLLTRLKMMVEGFRITSVITSHAVDELRLQTGNRIFAWIKTNEIMLGQP